jgi:4-alpha-glucanotransferase
MGDIPFGVSYFSADVWAAPELFDHQWSGGAPPERNFDGDAFVLKWGQNWGVPLYLWEAHRATQFAWWRQRARKVEAAFHLFRIDHVLGFYRIYGFPWRPTRNAEFLPLTPEEAMMRTGGELPRFLPNDDDTPEHKAANRAQGEELLRVLQAEAGARALVGEDLGTVPDYVRPSLLSLGIPGFKVPQWEDEPDGRLTPGAEYPRCSIATYATHDHDPLRVFWEKRMATILQALERPEELAAERDRAWREVRQLAEWAGFEVPSMMAFEAVHEPLLEALFRCNSWLAVVMITDLLGTEQRFNVPGSVGDMNWSARLPADWAKQASGHNARIAEVLQASGRE